MAEDAKSYVASLYEKELGRSGAGDTGVDYWANAIASGQLTKQQVANAIAQSTEAQIGRTYKQELGRSAAGDTGAGYWAQAVESGQMSLDEARRAIARSEEGAKYDVERVYQSELRRAASDPGAQYWRDALMRGEITEDQFVNAVRASEEYKRLNAPPPAPPPTPAPVPSPYTTNTAPGLERYASQLQQLQQQAIASTEKGFFEPTYPVSQPTTPTATTGTEPATTAPATTTAAAPVAAQPITPAPAVQVPMTYLAPAPPQYRDIDPFQSPFSTPFRSYFDIANARPQMAYPSPFVQQPSPEPVPGQAQVMSPSPFPFQYYQGMYASPQATTTQGLPAPTTPTT